MKYWVFAIVLNFFVFVALWWLAGWLEYRESSRG